MSDHPLLSSRGIDDKRWARIEPLLPTSRARSPRQRDDRVMIEAILWRRAHEAPWRALPEEFGPWQTAWGRERWYRATGVLALIFEIVDEDR